MLLVVGYAERILPVHRIKQPAVLQKEAGNIFSRRRFHQGFNDRPVGPQPLERRRAVLLEINPVAIDDRGHDAVSLGRGEGDFPAGAVPAEFVVVLEACKAVNPFVLPIQVSPSVVPPHRPPDGVAHGGVGLAGAVIGDKGGGWCGGGRGAGRGGPGRAGLGCGGAAARAGGRLLRRSPVLGGGGIRGAVGCCDAAVGYPGAGGAAAPASARQGGRLAGRTGGQGGEALPRDDVQDHKGEAGDPHGQRHEQRYRPQDRPVALLFQQLIGGFPQLPVPSGQDVVQHPLGGGGAEDVGPDQGAQADRDHGGRAAAVQGFVDPLDLELLGQPLFCLGEPAAHRALRLIQQAGDFRQLHAVVIMQGQHLGVPGIHLREDLFYIRPAFRRFGIFLGQIVRKVGDVLPRGPLPGEVG